jgi:uncharacterized protein (TIGR02466 family)
VSRTFQTDDHITLAYPTPVHSRVMPGHGHVNTRLREVILEHERGEPGLRKSNIGGWHSETDLLKWNCAEIATVLDWFGQAVKQLNDFMVAPEYVSGEMDASAWANVCREGDYHQPHYHPASDWSGVYYVASGSEGVEPGPAGRIDLLDPRTATGQMDTPGRPFTGTLQFPPEPGLLIVFPSWLMHHVHPHHGSAERISIALNARMLTVQAPPRKPFWKR